MKGSQQTFYGLAVWNCLAWMFFQTASLFVTSIGIPIPLQTNPARRRAVPSGIPEEPLKSKQMESCFLKKLFGNRL